MLPGPPSYIELNLPGIRKRDRLIRVTGSDDLAEPSTWHVIRNALVVGVVEYPDLDGVACR